MKKNNLLIDKTMKAFERLSFRGIDVSDPFVWWPLNFVLYMPLYLPQFIRDFFPDYRLLRKSTPLEKIAQAFQYPTALWLGLVPLLNGSKMAGLKKEEGIKIILEFLKMLEFSMVGNIFCEDKKNIIWAKTKVKNLVKETNWLDTRSKPDFAKFFARLHSGLLSLDEAVFWNANCASREIHGPYKVKWENAPCQLIVREYYNLNEPQLLPKNLSSPYGSIITYSIYDSRVRFDFPILNDYTHDLPLIENTKAVWGFVERNGEIEVLDRKESIIRNCLLIEEKSFEIGSWAESLTKKEQVVETVNRYYYRVKPIRDLLRKDWQAPKPLLQSIRKKISSFKPVQEKKRMTKKQFHQIFDPRIDLE